MRRFPQNCILALVASVVLTLAFTGCQDENPGRTAECDPPCRDDQICLDGQRCVVRITPPDAAGFDDIDESDADEGVTSPDGLPYRAPCVRDSDCASGLCIETRDGQLCTRLCENTADCEVGSWDCQLLSDSGAALTQLCAPRSNLCVPCQVDLNCLGSLCITVEDGDFCMQDCDEDDDCPDGFSCGEISRDVDGTTGVVTQCVPDSGFCGNCVDRDGDGFGEGVGCLGPDCDDDDPAINPGMIDSCDGINSDCDDEIDEDNLCDTAFADDIACEAGTCIIDTCLLGRRDCNGIYEDGCETSLDSQTSCGACSSVVPDADCNALSSSTGVGYQCVADPTAEGGFACAETGCQDGFGICAGSASCVSLTDESTCGGSCLSCDAETGVSDGVCVVLSEDPITAACRPADGDNSCDEGFCEIDRDDTDCESIRETYRCGPDCSAAFTDCRSLPNIREPSCNSDDGTCAFESCQAGFADCNEQPEDGCESSTFNMSTCTSGCMDCLDFVNDIGGDYHVADSIACDGDGCTFVCDSGWGDCGVDGPGNPRDFLDGCETSLAQTTSCGSCVNDCSGRYPNSLGSCGSDLPSGTDSTGCGLGSCIDGFVDADGELVNGCECFPSGYDEPDADGDNNWVDLNCDTIDGELGDSTFVAPDGTGNCLTPESACSSVNAAIAAARTRGRSWVLVQRGFYEEEIELTGSVSIAGGYDGSWQRGDHREPSYATVIIGPGYEEPEGRYTGLTLTGAGSAANPVRIRNLRIEAPSVGIDGEPETSPGGHGKSSFGVVASNSHVELANLSLAMGNAANGVRGDDGERGWTTAAPSGMFGLPNDGGSGGDAGDGATHACSGTSTTGGDGGDGGAGGLLGLDGSPGADGSCGRHNGYNVSTQCSSSTTDGTRGDGGAGSQPGLSGLRGRHGVPGARGTAADSRLRMVATGGLELSPGADATSGTHAGGGGGGGGGGGTSGALIGLSSRGGAGGGGGGAGGCAAASGGTAGTPGGSVVGVLAIGGSISLDDVEVIGATAGTGGDGGSGAAGQSGGTGGISLTSQNAPAGGSGGDGGDGGDSGGGAGGSGGHVLGLLSVDNDVDADDIKIFGGSPGRGGAGGFGFSASLAGERGSDGCSRDVVQCPSATTCPDHCASP